MSIPPDTKDWTWVLNTPCAECGFDAAVVEPDLVAGRLRDMVAAWRDVLARDDARERRDPSRWSDLEYGCHVRDVFRLFDERLGLMLAQDGPHFANWDQDATALEDDYAAQDPARVAGELEAAAHTLSARLDSVEGEGWDRTGFRSDNAAFTVSSFSRYLLHDPVHHLWDVDLGAG